MYLQVSAVRRPDADNMVKLLRERGFPALLGESSKQGLFRVLVGPYKTNTEMGRVKTDLKAKGFDSIVAK
jgi:cell division septation protein DedD